MNVTNELPRDQNLDICTYIYIAGQKFKKGKAKKLVKSNKSIKKICEIAFLAVLNFFPVEKLIFGHF